MYTTEISVHAHAEFSHYYGLQAMYTQWKGTKKWRGPCTFGPLLPESKGDLGSPQDRRQ